MPEGTKVGDVFLEGHIDVDEKEMAAFNRALSNSLKKHLPQMSKDIKAELGKTLGMAFEDSVDSGKKNHINAGRAIGRLISMGAASGIHDNARLIRDAMIVTMAGAAGVIGVTLAGAIQAAFAIAPAAIASLPGLLLGVVGAAGVLSIALSGVGKGFSSALSEAFDEKGWEKFEEAIEGLSYHTRSFLYTVREFAPELKAFRNALADGFFGGNSNEAFRAFAGMLEKLKPSMTGVADKFGDIARAMAFWAASAPAVENFKQIFAGIDAFLDTIRPALLNVIDAFFDLGAQGAAFAETFGEKVSSALNKIADWARGADLAALFERAKPAMEDVNRILSAIWGTLQNLFGQQSATPGGGPLEMLADIFEGIERGSVHVMNFVQMVKDLPGPVQELLKAAGVLALLSFPISSLVGSLAGVVQSFMALTPVLAALGITGGTALAVIAGLAGIVLFMVGVFVLAWTRSEEFRTKIKGLGESIKRAWEEDIKPALHEFRLAILELVRSAERLMESMGLTWGDLGTMIYLAIMTMIGYLVLFINAMTSLTIWITAQLDAIGRAVTFFRDLWNNAWQLMVLTGETFKTWLLNTLLLAFTTLQLGIESAMQLAVRAFGSAWETMKETAKAPIRTIIEFVNDPLIKGYNIVAKAVGIDQIEPIPIPFAHGGIAPGYGNKDTVPAMLTPGEGILTKDEMSRLGGPRGFMALRGIIQGFAGGGIVQTLSDAFGSGGSGMASVAGLSSEQMGNAAEIIRVGRQMGFPQQGLLVALITAMQESNLRNLGHLGAANDHDSVGLFQQRPSQGWGSVSELTTPAVAASKFFSALGRVPGWQGLAPTAAAQAVQGSAFPSAYAKWMGTASQILGGAGSGLMGFFSNPIENFISGMMGELPNIGSHPFAQVLMGMAKQLVSGAAKKAFETATFGLFGSGVVTGTPGSAGIGLNAIINLVKGLSGLLGVKATVTSGYRPGDPGHHGSGRAVDFGGYNQDALAASLFRMGGSLLELIHTTDTRGYYIKNGRAVSSYGSEDAKHRDHIHVAMDKGGALGPGRTVVDNFTGKPEAVLNPQHSAFVGRVLSGDALNLQNTLYIQLPGMDEYVEAKIMSSEQRVVDEIRRGTGRR